MGRKGLDLIVLAFFIIVQVLVHNYFQQVIFQHLKHVTVKAYIVFIGMIRILLVLPVCYNFGPL